MGIGFLEVWANIKEPSEKCCLHLNKLSWHSCLLIANKFGKSCKKYFLSPFDSLY